jgi:hypothetical protein
LDRDGVLPKLANMHNASYVDAFFYFLSSELMAADPAFRHGIEFYGSYLGVKNNFLYNLDEDYIMQSTFFHQNNGVLFHAKVPANLASGSRRQGVKLEVGEGAESVDLLAVEEVDVLVGASPGEVVVEEVTVTPPEEVEEPAPSIECDVVNVTNRIEVDAFGAELQPVDELEFNNVSEEGGAAVLLPRHPPVVPLGPETEDDSIEGNDSASSNTEGSEEENDDWSDERDDDEDRARQGCSGGGGGR